MRLARRPARDHRAHPREVVPRLDGDHRTHRGPRRRGAEPARPRRHRPPSRWRSRTPPRRRSRSAAVRAAPTFDAKVKIERVAPARADAALRDGDVDAVLTRRGIRAEDDPDDKLVDTIQAANRQVQTAAALQRAGLSPAQQRAALSPPALRVSTLEAIGPRPRRQERVRVRRGARPLRAAAHLRRSGSRRGWWRRSPRGSSRCCSRRSGPAQLLAGKVIGLGVLGFARSCSSRGSASLAASAAGRSRSTPTCRARRRSRSRGSCSATRSTPPRTPAPVRSVPRQEELQSATTPLNMAILVSYFVAFAVLQNPDGTIAGRRASSRSRRR